MGGAVVDGDGGGGGVAPPVGCGTVVPLVGAGNEPVPVPPFVGYDVGTL